MSTPVMGETVPGYHISVDIRLRNRFYINTYFLIMRQKMVWCTIPGEAGSYRLQMFYPTGNPLLHEGALLVLTIIMQEYLGN